MPTVSVEVHPPLSHSLRANKADDPVCWMEEVAQGETLRRLLERLVHQRPDFGKIYDPARGVVPEQMELFVNGRFYELLGGLTYLLRERDTLTLRAKDGK